MLNVNIFQIYWHIVKTLSKSLNFNPKVNLILSVLTFRIRKLENIHTFLNIKHFNS